MWTHNHILFCKNVSWVGEKEGWKCVFFLFLTCCYFLSFFLFLSNETLQIKVAQGKCNVITIKCPFFWQFAMFKNNKAIQKKALYRLFCLKCLRPLQVQWTHTWSAGLCVTFSTFFTAGKMHFFPSTEYSGAIKRRCTLRVLDEREHSKKNGWI